MKTTWQNRSQKSLLALAVSSAIFSAYSQAQTAAETAADKAKKDAAAVETTIEKIEVRGFGATLGKSLLQKKVADSVVEIVSTDDLGSLPDVTIADALGRLPGVAAERDRGNASSISIRGMGHA